MLSGFLEIEVSLSAEKPGFPDEPRFHSEEPGFSNSFLLAGEKLCVFPWRKT